MVIRAVIQRVLQSSVYLPEDRIVTGEVEQGLLVLLAVGLDDDEEDLQYIFDKIVHLRIFEDEDGKMNLSAKDVQPQFLVVSQFTLYADCRKGRRPSFTKAALPDKANLMYEQFVTKLRELGFKTETGKFAAHMQVSLVNDGPVTIILVSEQR